MKTQFIRCYPNLPSTSLKPQIVTTQNKINMSDPVYLYAHLKLPPVQKIPLTKKRSISLKQRMPLEMVKHIEVVQISKTTHTASLFMSKAVTTNVISGMKWFTIQV